MQLNENRVREQAYKIWEAEGRPEGCAEKHWSMACEYEASIQDDQSDSYRTLGQEDTEALTPHHHPTKHKKGRHNSH